MFAKMYRYTIGPLFAGILLLALAPFNAHADGGAPNRAYIAGTTNGISVLDIAQQRVIGSLPAKGNPHEVLLSLDGRFLYMTQPQLGNVAVLAARTGATICTVNVPGQPTLLAVDTTSNTMYAAGNGARSVTVFDPANCTIKRTLQADGPIYGLAVAQLGASGTSGGDQVWVSTPTTVDIFGDANGQTLGSFNVEGGPEYISIPIGSAAYVTTRQGSVVGVDLASHKQTRLVSGGKYGPMDFDEQTGEVFVPDQVHHQIVVLTPINSGVPTPHEPSRLIKLEATPNSIAITSDGQLGFVAMHNGHVAMLDIPGRQLITTYTVGGDPQFIITGLNPPLIGTTPQQATLLSPVLNVAAYVLIAALLIAPFIFFQRNKKSRQKSMLAFSSMPSQVADEAHEPSLPQTPRIQQNDQGNETPPVDG
ncbi:MAG TPA: YncE family protein [Ktedonobacteraceae bacterium]|jgi:hypothetical protein|nr:YncE family protein [Ktedonobacteraceae bacterium]